MKEKLLKAVGNLGDLLAKGFRAIPFARLKTKGGARVAGAVVAVIILLMIVLSLIWGRAPGRYDVREAAIKLANGDSNKLVTGYVTTATLITMTEKMLEKPGGYLTNDITPPSVFMDDIPNWEYGLIHCIRDLAASLRNDMSRSRSQSLENPDLAKASPLFHYNNDSWVFPRTESQYRDGVKHTSIFLEKLAEQSNPDAQFYARADNLRDFMAKAEKRLGGYSQRLSASVGEVRVNTDLAGDEAARQSTFTSGQLVAKTPWLKIDDVFFEARGYTWGLLHAMKAVRIDFATVLEKKNALALVDQIIRELEGAQRRVWSPMILNGSGFGLFANHSLVMASYVSRANAALIDLRDVLSQG